ncbi:MAG: glycoside hydrolase family 127 protein [Candidatus Latescibacteria bacterium]|nr:glycoside hydrolase family 127 protein [Candidatus Latescibacterota bacterium]
MSQIPDTLDLAARARAALNYFIQNPDPEARFQPHFIANLEADPPYLEHSEWDFGDVSSRFVETIAYIRLMTGDLSGLEEEAGLRKFMLSFLDSGDGLLYRPKSAYGAYQLASSGGNAGAYIWDQGRVLYALLTWYLIEGDEDVLQRTEKLIDGLDQIAVREGDTCYFPSEVYLGNGEWADHVLMWVPDGQPIDPLVRYFELTGDRKALDLARKLAKSVLTRKPLTFGPDGAMLRDAHNTHFHSRTAALVGLLRLGIATGDEDLIGFVEKAYRWARAQGSSYGWMLEQLRTPKWSETCTITDMINLAVLLAETGRDEYWGDVERFTRNCLVESQILSQDMLPQPWRKVPEQIPGSRSYDRVAERVIGGFVGSVFPNDRYFEADWNDGFGISGCCSPSGTKGLYLAWSHILTRKSDGVWINLMLNANTPWVEIHSALPYRGRLRILVKKTSKVCVRIPSWVEKNNVEVERNGEPQDVIWEGAYVVREDLKEGDEIEVRYPVKSCEVVEKVAGEEYLLHWRGYTLVGIEPPGKRMPLFQRKEMNRNKVPLKPSAPPEAAKENFHLW